MCILKPLLLVLILISVNAYSARTEFLSSARALAMGDAWVNLVDDGYALFYNPAALAKQNRPSLRFLDLQLGADTELVSGKVTQIPSLMTSSGMKKILEETQGKFMSTEAQVFPHFVMKNFGLGVFGKASNGMRYTGAGQVDIKSEYIGGANIGFGIKLFSGILKLGVDAMYIDYAVRNENVAAESITGFRKDLKEGKGLSYNAGALLTAPFKFLPAIGVVARNISNFKPVGGGYFSQPNAGDPEVKKMSFDAGFSIQPYITSTTRINFEVDYRDVTNTTKQGVMSRINFGAELEINYWICLRGGYREAYPSVGLGIKSKRDAFDFTVYGEEVGGAYRASQDRRYLLRYSGGL